MNAIAARHSPKRKANRLRKLPGVALLAAQPGSLRSRFAHPDAIHIFLIFLIASVLPAGYK
jgi:hypothetical protein